MLVRRIIVLNLASDDSGEMMYLSSIPLSNWVFKPCAVVLL